MTSAPDLRDRLCDSLLQDFRQEYADAVETWRSLEAKGQVLVTVGGVFLAAAFAFARDLRGLAFLEKTLLATALALLVAVVLLALSVFRVVPVKKPPLGSFSENGVFDLLGRPDADLSAYVQRFAKDRATEWRDVIQSISSVNERKAAWVRRSQFCLVVAVVDTVVFTLLRVLR
ncbi:MAG: hypothetical protein IMZ62_00050 [Chloroflexi bacterium]|nr:hypothetical protein [Chloroflexota bacterium]